MDVKWTPKGTSGASCSHARAWSAQGQGTITLQDPTMPSSSEQMMASLTAWHIPKSSALTNNKRASAGYPKRLFVRAVFRVFIVIARPLPPSLPFTRRVEGHHRGHPGVPDVAGGAAGRSGGTSLLVGREQGEGSTRRAAHEGYPFGVHAVAGGVLLNPSDRAGHV